MRKLGCLLFLCALWINTGSVTAQDNPTVRVMTYNIHVAVGTDGVLDLQRIAAIIRQHDPDIVGLQEVDMNTQRTGGVNQLTELRKATGMKHAFYGQTIEFQGGAYGIGVLVKEGWQIAGWQVEPIPEPGGREPRVLQAIHLRQSDIQENPAEFIFLNTHLDHVQDDSYRLRALPVIQRFVEQYAQTPMILVGDMNDQPDSRLINRLNEHWQDAETAPQRLAGEPQTPSSKIDYIFFRPWERWRVVDYQTIQEPVASDHLPIQAEFEWIPAETRASRIRE